MLRTPICDLLGCDYPVILAGMGGVARSELVAAVSGAGGFGFLGMVRESPDLIRREIDRVRSLTSGNFGINIIPACTAPDLLEAQLAAIIEERVTVVALFWDVTEGVIARLHRAGCRVICQVGSLNDAMEAVAAGADALIVQGVEAGGHVRGKASLKALLPEILGRTQVPVLAAGGIIDGKGLAAAILLGAQGAVIGTGFVATRESFAHDYYKSRIIEARAGETIMTEAFHVNWPKGALVRVLPNSVTRGEHGDYATGERLVIGSEQGRPIYLFSTDSPQCNMTGDFEAMALYAGEGSGQIQSICSAAERLEMIASEAADILRRGRPHG